MLRNEGLCKQGVVAACHVVWEYVVESAAGWVCVVCYVMRDCVNRVLWQHVMLCGNTLLRVQLGRCASYVM